MFEDRPSRPEDTEMIKSLKNELNAKEEELKIIAEELKYFRNQLKNRDNTYYKVYKY